MWTLGKVTRTWNTNWESSAILQERRGGHLDKGGGTKRRELIPPLIMSWNGQDLAINQVYSVTVTARFQFGGRNELCYS